MRGRGWRCTRRGAATAAQLSGVVGPAAPGPLAAVAGAAMVEAFPTAFLAVLLSDAVLSGAGWRARRPLGPAV